MPIYIHRLLKNDYKLYKVSENVKKIINKISLYYIYTTFILCVYTVVSQFMGFKKES